MFPDPEIDELRRRLETRFGLALASGVESFDGGAFPVIRPQDLDIGTGFCVALSRTHRQLEASFRADRFAAAMLRQMGSCQGQARQSFDAIRAQAERDGLGVYVSVNEEAVRTLKDAEDCEWRSFELDVTLRRSPRLALGEVFAKQLLITSICLSLVAVLLPIDELDGEEDLGARGLPEGAKTRVEVNRYERSSANRAACIAHFGATCTACKFDFESFYGELGEGYIEVHHRTPVSALGANYFVNPITDLVPLCANCHAMVHRTSIPLPVEDLEGVINRRRSPPPL